MGPPKLETDQLVLRPFRPADAPAVARLAGRREIADTTITIPHPYSQAQALSWITASVRRMEAGEEFAFAMTRRPDDVLVGGIGLREIDLEHSLAEMGFWIGVEYWGLGYGTEAVRAIVQFGFEQLHLNRIHAHHMVRNPASGRVLEKAGLRPEGVLRQRVRKWGRFEDVVIRAILRTDARR